MAVMTVIEKFMLFPTAAISVVASGNYQELHILTSKILA